MAEKPKDARSSANRGAPSPKIVPRSHPEVPPQPANIEALMKLAAVARVLAAGINREAGPETAAEAVPNTQKGHRFQRAASYETRVGDISMGDEPAQAPDANSDRGVEPSAPEQRSVNSAPTRTLAKSQRSAKLLALRKHPFFVWIVVQVFCLGLVFLGVLLGAWGSGPSALPAATGPRKEAPSRPAAASSGAALNTVDAATARSLETVNLALAKEDTGDLRSAQSLLESLLDSPTPLPGTEYQLAWLALRRNNQANADLHLERSIVANEAVAPCCYLRAAIDGAKGDYRAASAELRLAAQADPFNGRYFFYWGESLRRNGQLQDAAKCLRQALARPGTAQERELYEFKLRLAQMEAGRGDPFGDELEEKLRQPSPSGDWLLLAAAQNLQRNAFAAAADFLQRASRLLPPQTFRTWVGDYAFQCHAAEPQVAAILQVPLPQPASASMPPPSATVAPAAPVLEAAVALIPPLPASDQPSSPPAAALPPDPTVCSPAEGDPALWHRAGPSA